MFRFISLVICFLFLAANGRAQDMTTGASPARGPDRPAGYLAREDIPDSTILLPPPPAPDSAAMAHDEDLNRRLLDLRDTARWKLAARDAIPNPGQVFSCALGLPVSKQDTPELFTLLMRIGVDVGMAVNPTKKLYQRKRPFLINKQPTCMPGSEDKTARDGSYPSGHTATGWVWALILTELMPERTDAILTRGWEYGQSRAVCNVHWQSDITQGRVVGATLVARLHANETFRADLDKARREIAATRAEKLLPGQDCEAETRALALR